MLIQLLLYKDAEQGLQGCDVLGTSCCSYKRVQKKSQGNCFGITIDPSKEASVTVREGEYVHFPTSHPNHPIKVTAIDPVFINPNSFDFLKDVFHRIGASCRASWYYPGDPDAHECLNVAMDGFPCLVSTQVIENVLICAECGKVLKKDVG